MPERTSAYRCTTLDPTTYDAYSAAHPQGNFQQSTRMNEVRRRTGVEVELLGVYRGDELVAATSLEIHKSKLSTFAEVHDGPLCDLEDAQLTEFVFAELKRRARKAGAAQLSITPELPYRYRDEWGRELPTSDDEPWPANVPAGLAATPDQTAFDNVLSCGFVHDGFVRDYTAVPRWRFVKDLAGIGSEQELLSTYAKNTKRNVRIAQNSCVNVERIGRDELGVFHDICDMSSERQGFDNRPLEYFELLFDCLGDTAEFYVAYIDARGFLKSWEDKRDEFAREIEHLHKMAEKGPLSPKNEK
ncbi:MAG: peptidoglycan bridge formation glycyltransferase FemA/FemB family protein, partial [Atopobiaceae bacterium]|nr:peptidoglycan bridge formation glycyltransferase FemA/FemB family protein [Atopobiaceae bacterium]